MNLNIQNSGQYQYPVFAPNTNYAFVPNLGNACPIIDTPVCGINGQTYQNSCFLQKAGISFAYDGWCVHSADGGSSALPGSLEDKSAANGYDASQQIYPTDCPCNDNFVPVCGANGITFANACRAECRGINPVKFGPCDHFGWKLEEVKECKCNDDFRFVCGTDGITYENSCVSACFDIIVKINGMCDQPCDCPFYYKPVCGADGMSYSNNCQMNCAGTYKIADEACNEDSLGECAKCFGSIHKVCSREGDTYDNHCFMKCADAHFAYNGNCIEHDRHGKCKCTDMFLPVCGENSMTYDNECQMNCAGVRMLYPGECEKEEACGCRMKPKEDTCGNDGRTYENMCFMGCHRRVKPVARGPCKPIKPTQCICPPNFRPVCGTDMRTYMNPCVASCVKVNIAWYGKCEIRIPKPKIKRKKKCHSYCNHNPYLVYQPVMMPQMPCQTHMSYQHKTCLPYEFVSMNPFKGMYNPHHHQSDEGYMIQLPSLPYLPKMKPNPKKEAYESLDKDLPKLDDLLKILFPDASQKEEVMEKLNLEEDNDDAPSINIFVPIYSDQHKEELVQEKKENSFIVKKKHYNISHEIMTACQQNPYIYYMYFYSLIYYNYCTPET
ncbi:MAG: hypothetical protein GY938_09700 [Ketobacter sp.]|nr:hypothetical protein [Ketobacter sp.]